MSAILHRRGAPLYQQRTASGTPASKSRLSKARAANPLPTRTCTIGLVGSVPGTAEQDECNGLAKLVAEEPAVATDINYQALLSGLIERWRLSARDAGRIAWVTETAAQRAICNDPIALQLESCHRIDVLEEIDGLLRRHLGGGRLVPHWLRLICSVEDQSPLHLLEGPTRTLRQLRWRLFSQLADREDGGCSS